MGCGVRMAASVPARRVEIVRPASGTRESRQFLLRASLLLPAVLLVWWFVLQSPMLVLLRPSEETILRFAGSRAANPIVEEDSGEWTFRVPIEGIADGARINSIDFTMPRADVILFTFSAPFFWAILLAVSHKRFGGRALLWGTLAIGIAEVLLLFAFLKISAYGELAQFHPATASLKWLSDLSIYLIVNVIPFVLPISTALAVCPELRTKLFLNWSTADNSSLPSPAGLHVSMIARGRHYQPRR